jgi:hypothetical protein
MGWEYNRRIGGLRSYNQSRESFKANERCFIRKEHKCGKIFGASKSCFIACPTDDSLEPILELMSEKLGRSKIEPIIAVKERAYGQDIFCTKICGRIIESQFCIVILDDTIKENENIPNPNVYYEYGLMTALRKHIIPLQNDELELAFNIQSYDTIKYEARNIGTELDRAIKDAIKITESNEIQEKSPLSERTILRRLELNGFELKDREWVLSEVINDTDFKGYSHYETNSYLYLGKIDSEEELSDYLDDLGVVLYRTERHIEKLEKQLAFYEKQKLKEKNPQSVPEKNIIYRSGPRNFGNMQKILDMAGKIIIGFIVGPDIDKTEFSEKSQDILDEYDRYELIFNDGDEIEIEGKTISLAPSY